MPFNDMEMCSYNYCAAVNHADGSDLWWLLKGSDAGKRRSRTGEESGKGGSRATYGNRQEGQREVIKLEERNSV